MRRHDMTKKIDIDIDIHIAILLGHIDENLYDIDNVGGEAIFVLGKVIFTSWRAIFILGKVILNS